MKPQFLMEEGEDFIRTPDDAFDDIEYMEMRRDIGGDGFWCMHWGEVGERGDGICGIECKGYKPRNGRSGICMNWRHAFIETSRKFMKQNGQWHLVDTATPS